jgi:hypothetical protein
MWNYLDQGNTTAYLLPLGWVGHILSTFIYALQSFQHVLVPLAFMCAILMNPNT